MNTFTVRLYGSPSTGGLSTSHEVTSVDPTYVKDSNVLSFTDPNGALVAVFDRAAVVSITLKQPEPVQP